jgi:hypothetical protein
MKTMKMTCLHMEFVLIFIIGPSRSKLGRTLGSRLLTLASLTLSFQVRPASWFGSMILASVVE